MSIIEYVISRLDKDQFDCPYAELGPNKGNIEIDWDSYYLTREFRKIELRMKPVPVENPKYCLA